jgi:hypothetical protein
MLRTRLALLALAAGLGLVSGCAELSHHSWFGRGTACGPGYESFSEGPPGFDGPVLEGAAPYVGQPGYPAAPGLTRPVAPGDVMPQLSTPPRLVPQPQAQPSPYTPSYQSRTVGR